MGAEVESEGLSSFCVAVQVQLPVPLSMSLPSIGKSANNMFEIEGTVKRPCCGCLLVRMTWLTTVYLCVNLKYSRVNKERQWIVIVEDVSTWFGICVDKLSIAVFGSMMSQRNHGYWSYLSQFGQLDSPVACMGLSEHSLRASSSYHNCIKQKAWNNCSGHFSQESFVCV